MSMGYVDPDDGESSEYAGFDQFEIDLMYDFGSGLTARVDLEDQNEDSGVNLEQAILNYAVTDMFSVKAGRFLSYTGWETEEPTGLFQYSGTGYAPYFYGYYQQGVSAMYSNGTFDLMFSAVNDLTDPDATDSEDLGFEFGAAFYPTESSVVKAFYSTEDMGDYTRDMFNIWGSIGIDSLTLAAEYNSAESTNVPDGEADGYLLMANYGFDKWGITFRYHAYQLDDAYGYTYEDASAFTLSPSYAFSDNLLIVFEARFDQEDVSDTDTTSFALEALVTF